MLSSKKHSHLLYNRIGGYATRKNRALLFEIGVGNFKFKQWICFKASGEMHKRHGLINSPTFLWDPILQSLFNQVSAIELLRKEFQDDVFPLKD